MKLKENNFTQSRFWYVCEDENEKKKKKSSIAHRKKITQI